MSLQTYADLKSAVGTWLNRADLTGYIPDFIRLGEQRIYYGADNPMPSQPLRIPAMQVQATGTITNGEIAFPTRFLEPIRVAAAVGGPERSLAYISPDQFTTSSSTPTAYTYLANAIKIMGAGSATYVLDYYQAPAALAADSDTNWVLANAPGIYLYAALIESAPFLGDASMLNGWMTMYKSAISAVNRSTKYQAAGSLATRVAA